MKLCTLKSKHIVFHGNCKDSRIRKAAEQLDTNRIVRQVISSRGIYDNDSPNVKRYSAAIKRAKSGTKAKVSVYD